MRKTVLTLCLSIAFVNVLTAQTFTLKSNELGGQFTLRQLANGFGCIGNNISPELHWEHAPKETKAFAVTLYDLDAPTGSGFWHWIVYNIPSSVTSLSTDAGNLSQKNLPNGAINASNDGGIAGYTGPCPPAGQQHRYVITVYALKDLIHIEKNASTALTGLFINTNTIVKASLLIYAQQ
jgi:hypothetical protein